VTGFAGRVRQLESSAPGSADAFSVTQEPQAGCFAGTWVRSATVRLLIGGLIGGRGGSTRRRGESDDRRWGKGGRESAEGVGSAPATNQPHDEQQQDRSDDRTDQASRLQNAVVGVEPEQHRAKESAEQRTPDTE
jgi:hypothetical protein